MPDGGSSSLSTVKDIVGIGAGAASIAGTAASFFNSPKSQAPDLSALTEAANRESADAKAEKLRIEAEEAARKRLRLSGNYGSRSLFTNGETGFSPTLGGP